MKSNSTRFRAATCSERARLGPGFIARWHAASPQYGLQRIRNFHTGTLTLIGDNLLLIRRVLDVAGVITNARNPPTATSTAAIRPVSVDPRHRSDVSIAQIAAVPRQLGERAISDPELPFEIDPMNGR